MKNLLSISLGSICLFFILSCENKPDLQPVIDFNSVEVSECNDDLKSFANDTAWLEIKKVDNYLEIYGHNLEFYCGLDSLEVQSQILDNNIDLEFEFFGTPTFCYCPRDVKFYVGPLENVLYSLSLIESEQSYERDTFYFEFDFANDIDTIIYRIGMFSEFGLYNHPLSYQYTVSGGCNLDEESIYTKYAGELNNDTIIFTRNGEKLNIFAGINWTCCVEFGTTSYSVGDTLIMQINTLNDDMCDCVCYYTFDFEYANYIEQSFYYKLYIDELLIKNGFFYPPK